jgi:hypothetical protein
MRRSNRMKRIMREQWVHFFPSDARTETMRPSPRASRGTSPERRARSTGHMRVVGIVLAAVFCGADFLQTQSSTFKSGRDLVPLTVTVTDRTGRGTRTGSTLREVIVPQSPQSGRPFRSISR